MADTYLDTVKEVITEIGQHKSVSEIFSNIDSMPYPLWSVFVY